MKILILTDGLPPKVLGGAGQIAWTTAIGMAKQGHDVTILTATEDGSPPSPPLGITVRAIPMKPSLWAHYRGVFSHTRSQEILRIIDDIKPDVIHAHSIAWQIGYRWIPGAHARGIPVFLTAHDVMYVAYGRVTGHEQMLFLKDLKRARWTYNPLRNLIIRLILNKHAHVLTVSNALRTYLESFGFKNLTTLHNGIDIHFWKPSMDQAEARKHLKLPADKTIFLLAGRLGFDKGSQIIARTLPNDAHLLLAGDVDDESFTSIKNRCHSLGRQTPEQLKTLYAACDVVLVPSICLDCFPTVNLEAMASGRPVIATTFGGSKEAILDGETGWIIDPRDERALHAKMQWCTDHRTELDHFGKNAHKRAEQEFSMENHIKALLSMYQNITASVQ